MQRRSFLTFVTALGATACRDAGRDPFVVAGIGSPTALVADDAGLYIASEGVFGVGAAILRVPWGGGMARAIALRERSVSSLAVGAREVFWTSSLTGALRAAPRDGGALPRVIGTHPRGYTASVAVDRDTCFASTLDGPLLAIPLSGGAPRVVHPEPAWRMRVARDGALVFATRDAVWVAPRDRSPRRLVDAPLVAALDVDATHVYLADASTPRGARHGRLRRVALAGGAVETLAEGLHDPNAIAVGTERVWYTGQEQGSASRSATRVLGDVARTGDSGRHREVPVGVTAMVIRGAWLYLAGKVSNEAGGVVRRRPA